MEDFKSMSDEELAALLSRHGISHGPIVETTRSLYEKKLTEIISGTKSSLREKSKASEGSDHNSSDHTEWYEETITYTEAYPRPSIRQRIREDFTSSPDVSEKLSSEGSYQEYLLSKPSVETASYRSSLGSEPLERRYFPLQSAPSSVVFGAKSNVAEDESDPENESTSEVQRLELELALIKAKSEADMKRIQLEAVEREKEEKRKSELERQRTEAELLRLRVEVEERERQRQHELQLKELEYEKEMEILRQRTPPQTSTTYSAVFDDKTKAAKGENESPSKAQMLEKELALIKAKTEEELQRIKLKAEEQEEANRRNADMERQRTQAALWQIRLEAQEQERERQHDLHLKELELEREMKLLRHRAPPQTARYDAQDSEKDGKYYAASSTYQTVSQSRPSRSMVSSTSVASKSYAEDSSQEKRFIPLWLQFLVFLLVAGFLVYLYFTVGSSDDNPFVTFME